MYALAVCSTSRGALVFATLELFILLIVAFSSRNVTRFAKTVFAVILILVAFLMLFAVFGNESVTDAVVKFAGQGDLGEDEGFALNKIINKKEVRIRFFPRTIENFKSNHLFGVGLGYTGNTDLYNPKAGAMNWYHMWWAQILGGMGLVGVFCYGYQLIGRIRLYKRKRDPLNTAMFLSYIGLFMMTQVNPGEFCPLPYAVIAVVYFILMEKSRN
jgi:energy-coupling factor transporter transmembrane protein EcfT